jgi:hypothetical protein
LQDTDPWDPSSLLRLGGAARKPPVITPRKARRFAASQRGVSGGQRGQTYTSLIPAGDYDFFGPAAPLALPVLWYPPASGPSTWVTCAPSIVASY